MKKILICFLIFAGLITYIVFYVVLSDTYSQKKFLRYMFSDESKRYMTDYYDRYSVDDYVISFDSAYYSSEAGIMLASFSIYRENVPISANDDRFQLSLTDKNAKIVVKKVLNKSDNSLILNMYVANCNNMEEIVICLYDTQNSNKLFAECEVNDSIFDYKYSIEDDVIIVTPFVTILNKSTDNGIETIEINLNADMTVKNLKRKVEANKTYFYYENVLQDFDIKSVSYMGKEYECVKGIKISTDPVIASQQFLKYVDYSDEYMNWDNPDVKRYDGIREACDDSPYGGPYEYTDEYSKSGVIYKVTYRTENDGLLGSIVVYLDENFVVFGEEFRE